MGERERGRERERESKAKQSKANLSCTSDAVVIKHRNALRTVLYRIDKKPLTALQYTIIILSPSLIPRHPSLPQSSALYAHDPPASPPLLLPLLLPLPLLLLREVQLQGLRRGRVLADLDEGLAAGLVGARELG